MAEREETAPVEFVDELIAHLVRRGNATLEKLGFKGTVSVKVHRCHLTSQRKR